MASHSHSHSQPHSHSQSQSQSQSQSSFIDQQLAGQLFVAARAHDALSEEVSNFLPASISDIFPLPSEHSRKYKTAAYSALVKSQHHKEEDDDDDSVTNDVKGNVVLHVFRDGLLQKVISSFLTMNDKLSLIFAVSDDAEENKDDQEDEDEVESEEGATSKKGGLSLSEDLFHRESEDLEFHRKQYLLQLVQTREVESKMQNLKQKLDRTRNVLNNPQSADLLRLNFMSSKLFLLRDITSKNYEDYFTARGNYTTWSLEHQSRYTATTNQALDKARMSMENLRHQNEAAVLRCRQLMSDVITGDVTDGVTSSKKTAIKSDQTKSKPRRRASVVVVAKDGVQLRTTAEVNEFHDMRQVGLTYLEPYRMRSGTQRDVVENREAGDDGHMNHDDASDNDSDGGGSNKSESSDGVAMTSRMPFSNVPDPQNEDSLIVVEEDEKKDEDRADEVEIVTKKVYVVDEKDLEEYRQKIAESLKEFEMELCEHLESVSRRALDSVKKKYISFELSDDIPMYLKDIKWKLDQKRKLVNTGANQIQATKESLAVDFERRLEKSYGFFLEQQMTKLKRIQSYCHVEGSI